MNLSNLQTFLAIVETGNLNRAAHKLHITQSTVNARLNTLEQTLGQPLFHRRKSGAELTSAGFRFERYAQLMTDLWRQAAQETALPESVAAVCNIGCEDTLWQQGCSPLIEEIRHNARDIALSVWPGDQSRLDRWMSSGLVDISVCYSPKLSEQWQAIRLFDEHLIQVASVSRKRVRSDPGYIYVDYGERFRQNHAAVYTGADTPMTIMGSAQWALEHLLKFGGSAYLPKSLVRAYVESRRLFPVEGSEVFTRPVYLVVNQKTSAEWPWFDGVVEKLRN